MQKLKHPLSDVVEALRQIILCANDQIGEEIKWNAPAFFYTGDMKPFDPKEYKRHIVVFNLHKKDCLQLVFLTGAKVNDTSGLLCIFRIMMTHHSVSWRPTIPVMETHPTKVF